MVWGLAATPEHIYCRPGKSVWQTREEAEAALEPNPYYCLCSIDADWETHTEPIIGETFRALTIPAIATIWIGDIEWKNKR